MTHALPAWLEPVLAFINTVDVEEGTDALDAWLAACGPPDRPGTATKEDHRLALDLRTGLRAAALANNGVPATDHDLARLRRALDRLPLVADTVTGVAPATANGVRAALGTIVAGYARAVATGEWQRLRRCPAEDCAWAFWDSSAKGTRRWCVMSVCGNRAKVRAFAARKAR